mmetsp:Transcript_23611/g.84270  ORF Transcript_23611/g.84270 Transcript_23611/m.84270 type:complete len:209 (+) Transcript_23611:114-740(+)
MVKDRRAVARAPSSAAGADVRRRTSRAPSSAAGSDERPAAGGVHAARTSVVETVWYPSSDPPTTRILGPSAVSSRVAAHAIRAVPMGGPGSNSIFATSRSSVVARATLFESMPPMIRTCISSTGTAAHAERAEFIFGPGVKAMVRTSRISVEFRQPLLYPPATMNRCSSKATTAQALRGAAIAGPGAKAMVSRLRTSVLPVFDAGQPT